jgi:diguanylate cyclase (GGDEF)-like protein/PAS domain S-box-containing protein
MAWYWAIAYSALSVAAFTGYRYQEIASPLLGGISALFTGTYVAAMYAANRVGESKRVTATQLLFMSVAITVLISLVGFGYSQSVGRLVVLVLMIILFVWSAKIFYVNVQLSIVGHAFMAKALLTSSTLFAGEFINTAQQSLWISVPNWIMTIILALVLVYTAIKQSRDRLEKVLNNIPDALVAGNTEGEWVFYNQRFADLAGLTTSAVKNHQQPEPEEWDIRNVLTKSDRLIMNGSALTPVTLERQISHKQGAPFQAEVIYSSYLEFGKVIVVAQIRDITERKLAEREKLRLVSSDPLTGLLNRQGFEIRLRELLWNAQQTQHICALFIVDIRDFKRVNDVVGTQQGDKLLKEIATMIRTQSEPNDLTARLGSDEFVIVIPHIAETTQLTYVLQRVQRVLAAIDSFMHKGDITLSINANVGIALSGEEAMIPSVLIHRAQLALYEAKARGINEYQVYEDALDSKFTAGVLIESALRKALYSDEFSLHYQPILDTQTKRIEKVEALARWNSSSLGFVSPAAFIPIAEQSDLIVDLGRWILRTAFLQAKIWHERYATAPVIGVNISVRQFLHKNFETELLRLTQEFKIDPAWIELELTESLFAGQDNGPLRMLLDRLRSEGFGLSLDDFGTGYSSLSYLAEFRLSAVKIDRSFVSEMDKDSKKRSIVKAIISMGHSLGLKVIAEGVETPAEYQGLLEDACDYVQGYLFSKPVPAEQLPAFDIPE